MDLKKFRDNRSAILFLLGIVFYIPIIILLYFDLDIDSLYYHRIIGNKLVYLMIYAITGLVLILYMIMRGNKTLARKTPLKALPLSLVLFAMAFFWDPNILTDKLRLFSLFLGNFFIIMFQGFRIFSLFFFILLVIFLQMQYHLRIGAGETRFWLYFVSISLASFLLTYLLFFVLFLFASVFPFLYPIIFPNFGEGTIASLATFLALFGSSNSVRLLEKYLAFDEKQALLASQSPEGRSGTFDYRGYFLRLFDLEMLVIHCTLVAGVWMMGVFLIDTYEVYPQEVSTSLLWFTYVLTIPYAIYLSLGE